MKKLLLIALLLTGVLQAQIVNIPDANFKNALLVSSTSIMVAKNLTGNFVSVDSNHDGNIQESEAQQISYLWLRNRNISDLTGIEVFTNLTFLNCEDNNIATFDVSALTQLSKLLCGINSISQIDITPLPLLQQFDCSHNLISTLDFSNADNLEILGCSYNQISTLDLSNLNNLSQLSVDHNMLTNLDIPSPANLTTLICEHNNISNIDFTVFTNLVSAYCADNNFSEITVTNLPHLTTFYGGSTNLTSITLNNLPLLTFFGIERSQLVNVDLSNLTSITELELFACYNLEAVDLSAMVNLHKFTASYDYALTSLDFSSNPLLYDFHATELGALSSINFKNGSLQNIGAMVFDSSMTSLAFICADEFEIEALQNLLTGSAISVNSYCTFVPGGAYNTINGTLTYDHDNNGCDAGDSILLFSKITINDGSQTGTEFADANGNYSFYTQSGNFTITPEIENAGFFNSSPVSASVNFPTVSDLVGTNNFCIAANGIHPDLEIIIAPIVPARPGFDAVYKITYKNKGNQTMSQDYGVTFFYNQNLMEFVNSDVIPATNGPGALTWNYTNLLPFESRSVYVTLNVNAPTDANPVNIGDVLTFNSAISPVGGDENMADNYFAYNQAVVGSYDPNEITCIEGEVVSPDEIGNYLHYIINFENTGTAAAQNIVVKNIIDSAKFDISSLQILSASHAVDARLTGNALELIFHNIYLDTGGHGNVLLKIKTNGNLVSGNSVAAKGDIFFDYNFPVSTNIATTIFQSLGINDNPLDASITIYPNPTQDIISIKAADTIKSIQLFDKQGRILQTRVVNENVGTIDVSAHSNGVYFLKITSEKGIKIEKIIKK